jgi:Polyketide cyclase / dehydrase and lipid transport
MTTRRLRVEGTATAIAPVDAVWALVADANRYATWGPWDQTGYEPTGIGPSEVGSVQVLRTAQRRFGRRTTTTERILEVEDRSRLAYTVVKGIPVRNYRGEIVLTADGATTRIVWTATFDRTFAGRLVHKALAGFFPDLVTRLAAAASPS